MNYQDTLHYLYHSTPMFQQIGGKAYKEGLDNTWALDKYFGHPHRKFRSIHVAGTNGKGSCSHTLAAVLQQAGYRTGLYTSPHLLDFRERIRLNGQPIPEDYVVRFVEQHRAFFEPLYPSFFELTTAMAFRYFADEKIDVAIIEVGMGGRLDCTNIITPDLCIITNISMDHTQFLGNTLEQIAAEKAGIIKPGIPVVIGETTPETYHIFIQKAQSVNAPIHFVLTAIPLLQKSGYQLDRKAIKQGFAHVMELTGLMGRWQKLHEHPTLVCDTGHNTGGIKYVVEQLKQQSYHTLRIVIGMVNDKDINGVLSLLPHDAVYYFTQASVQRALPADQLADKARAIGLQGTYYPNVNKAVLAAQKDCLPEDFIFVGGSYFIVADFLANRDALNLN